MPPEIAKEIPVGRYRMAVLKVEGLWKSYGSVRALSNVSASFLPGEIHAVLGENGAGKSTLMGVLAGLLAPDQGRVTLDDELLPPGKPFESRRRGIAMVHQHFTLVTEFTVLENLALARVEKLGKRLDLEALARPALDLARELGWPIEPQVLTSTLPVGAQQRVEILKNLGNDARVVIFDEPTAVLSPDEVEDLFRVLRQLKEAGRIVLFIAHKLREVLAVADRVTVLRKGHFVATAPIGEVDAQILAEWMVGDLPPALVKDSQPTHDGLQVQNLTVRGDRGEEAVRSLSLEVGAGEIVGIGGVDGNGQVELAESLAGIRPMESGSIQWKGSPIAIKAKYIPQDRQTDGLALNMSIEENMLIEGRHHPSLTRGPLFRPRAIRDWSKGLLARFDIRARSVVDPVRSQSGGNQQKVVVSRVLDQIPEFLIVSNPTRGLDLQAAAFVHQQILNAAAGGTAVLFISTDLDELAALADRTLFISSGQLSEAKDAAALLGGG